MNPRLAISIIGGVGFALGAVAAYAKLRQETGGAVTYANLRNKTGAARWLGVVTAVAIGVNAIYLGAAVGRYGTLETFRQSYTSTVLLAALIGLTGLGTHLAASLRGLDGFLFGMAAVVNFGSLALIHHTGTEVAFKPWFISHGLAFVVSGACFVANGVAAIAYLLMDGVLRRKRASRLVGALPPLESLEHFGRWMLMIGFPLFTYGVLTGICQLVRTHDPGPSAWLQDPVIVVSFMTWLLYAVMVGAMLLLPWMRGRLAAGLATCGMGLVVVVFLVIEVVSPLHR